MNSWLETNDLSLVFRRPFWQMTDDLSFHTAAEEDSLSHYKITSSSAPNYVAPRNIELAN